MPEPQVPTIGGSPDCGELRRCMGSWEPCRGDLRYRVSPDTRTSALSSDVRPVWGLLTDRIIRSPLMRYEHWILFSNAELNVPSGLNSVTVAVPSFARAIEIHFPTRASFFQIGRAHV